MTAREASPELVAQVRAAISDAYYDARNNGQTMEYAADTAVAALLPIIASVDANAHLRGSAESDLAADVLRHTERDWCHDHDPTTRPARSHVWIDGHQRTTMICPPPEVGSATPEETP